MSEVNNQAPVAPATEAAPQQEAQPDFDKMTGEEAVRWVEAQKAKQQTKKSPSVIDEAAREATEKVSGRPSAQAEPEKSVEKQTAAPKKFKVKVEGKEIEVDEQELLRGYSHQKAASKILQEGQQARKKAEAFINMMKDPQKLMDVLTQMGHDPRKLAEDYLVQQLKAETMDPKERELESARQKLKHYEDLERKRLEAVQKQHHEEMKKRFAEDYNKQFTAALKESGLPATKGTVAEMAKYISKAAKLGYKLEVNEAARLVKEDMHRIQSNLIGNLDGEQLIALLGDGVINKVRQYDVSRIKNPSEQLKTPDRSQQPVVNRGKSDKKPMTRQEWRDFNRRK